MIMIMTMMQRIKRSIQQFSSTLNIVIKVRWMNGFNVSFSKVLKTFIYGQLESVWKDGWMVLVFTSF